MELFRLSSGKKHDPAIDAWIAAQGNEFGPMALAWFTQMRRCGEDVLELMHDGCPVACVKDVAFGYVNVFTSHMNVGFFLGACLDDPADLLEGTGRRMRHVKLRVAEQRNLTELQNLIEVAYADAKRRME